MATVAAAPISKSLIIFIFSLAVSTLNLSLLMVSSPALILSLSVIPSLLTSITLLFAIRLKLDVSTLTAPSLIKSIL
jgi:hypothetical protein